MCVVLVRVSKGQGAGLLGRFECPDVRIIRCCLLRELLSVLPTWGLATVSMLWGYPVSTLKLFVHLRLSPRLAHPCEALRKRALRCWRAVANPSLWASWSCAWSRAALLLSCILVLFCFLAFVRGFVLYAYYCWIWLICSWLHSHLMPQNPKPSWKRATRGEPGGILYGNASLLAAGPCEGNICSRASAWAIGNTLGKSCCHLSWSSCVCPWVVILMEGGYLRLSAPCHPMALCLAYRYLRSTPSSFARSLSCFCCWY